MNNIVFNAQNIIDTLGINMNDDYNVKFEPDPQSIDITSRFFIDSHANPNSGCYMASDNFENSDTPGFMALLPTTLNWDGLVNLKLETNSAHIRDIMTLVNHYVRFFMVIKDIRVFVGHFIQLEIMTEYSYTDKLTLDKVELFKLRLDSPYETNYQMKKINVQYEVDEYLSKIGVDKIDLTMDLEALMVLVKMQKTIDSMVKI